PLSAAAAVYADARQEREQQSQDAQLSESARSVEVEWKADIGHFEQLLLTTAHNPAMVEVMRDPKRQAMWKRMLDVSLLNLTLNFPGMIDEACRIDATGAELSRVVKGNLAGDADLSPDESNNPFFMPT